jgi:hypothetical protein
MYGQLFGGGIKVKSCSFFLYVSCCKLLLSAENCLRKIKKKKQQNIRLIFMQWIKKDLFIRKKKKILFCFFNIMCFV